MIQPSILDQLSSFMELEPAEETGCHKLNAEQQKDICIHQALMPNGKRIRLLKTLLTSACERNCFYCPFRAGRDFRRTTLKPEQMARSFMALYRAGIAQGIFLSSGIAGGSQRTQDQLLATADILRKKYRFPGYIHLKLMPGAEQAQVEQAMCLADRVSLNLEAPNTERLGLLAPHKSFLEELLQPMRWVEEIRQTLPSHLGWKGRWPSMTTQFVVGAAGESDLELLSTTYQLHQNLRLARAYFSAFRPISDTPLAHQEPTSPRRQLHLYQASFLLRDYGFDLEELPFESAGNLPEHADPKMAWAEAHLQEQPIEINQADRRQLLRIPGIGPKGASAILGARYKGILHSVNDLRKIGINPSRSLPFILIDGQQPIRQLSFW